MRREKSKLTPEEKYSILQEAEREGYSETCRKYNLPLTTVGYWKKKYLTKGKDGLKAAYKRVDPGVRILEEENVRLKKIVAKQALEIEFKDELIKNGQAHFQRGKKL